MRMRWPPRAPANVKLAHAFGQRHHGGEHHRGGTANEDIHAKRLARLDRRRMMDADRTLDLIVQANFAIGFVLSAGKLNAIHAEVRVPPPRSRDVFRINLRQA